MDATRSRDALYPNAYAWLVLVSSMDLMLTWLVLSLGGHEVNPVARSILDLGGFPAMTVFKLAVVAGVIGACEFVGRQQPGKGRALSGVAVALSAVPVCWTLPMLFVEAASL